MMRLKLAAIEFGFLVESRRYIWPVLAISPNSLTPAVSLSWARAPRGPEKKMVGAFGRGSAAAQLLECGRELWVGGDAFGAMQAELQT